MLRSDTQTAMTRESGSIKILIIAEDQRRRFILRRDLQIAHYDVITAENEMEGLYLPGAIEPDLIILDMTVSHLDVFMVLERLKNDPITCFIPVIFLTDKNLAMMEDDGVPGGVYYVKTPYKFEEIQTCIRKALAARDEHERLLKSIQQVKSNLAVMLMQELRFPITVIAGFAELMNQQLSYSEPSVCVDYLQHIIRQAEHLKDLIEDFNYLIHSQQMVEEVDLIQLVRAAIERFQKQMEEKKQKINLKFHSGDNLTVQGKGHDLFMALRHLISNAHKFTQAGGTIAVTITPINDHVRIDVEDTGIGIPASQQGLILDNLHQGRQEPTERYGGRGLGLTIVRSVVAQHHGSMGFESKPGLGSRFWIDLPLSCPNDRVT